VISQALIFKPELINVLRPLTDQPLEGYAEELMVLELYRRRQISSGKAAELLGMDRVAFIQYASRLGVAFFDMSEQELAAEMENLAHWVEPRE
jgi:predicted HTH domain antitoxin